MSPDGFTRRSPMSLRLSEVHCQPLVDVDYPDSRIQIVARSKVLPCLRFEVKRGGQVDDLQF